MSSEVYSTLDEMKESYALWEALYTKKITPWEVENVCPFLIKYSSKLDLTPPKRVLIPLCGKALELKWFYDKGCEVVGIELIDIPVKEFFKEHNLSFKIRELSWAKVYETTDQRLKIYVADIYGVKSEEIGKFDVIWARTDYTVVQHQDREKYSKIMKQFCKEQFLYFLCTLQFSVPPHRVDTPPRPLSHEDTRKLYSDWCKIELAEEEDALKFYPDFKSTGTYPVSESYFILSSK